MAAWPSGLQGAGVVAGNVSTDDGNDAGRRLAENGVKFYSRISQVTKPVQSANLAKNLLKLNMQRGDAAINSVRKSKIYVPSWPRFSKMLKTWSFHVVVLQGTAAKCTKIYNARAKLFFCSLNLLFSGVPVAVAVVVCLSSLIRKSRVQGLHTATRGICFSVVPSSNLGHAF